MTISYVGVQINSGSADQITVPSWSLTTDDAYYMAVRFFGSTTPFTAGLHATVSGGGGSDWTLISDFSGITGSGSYHYGALFRFTGASNPVVSTVYTALLSGYGGQANDFTTQFAYRRTAASWDIQYSSAFITSADYTSGTTLSKQAPTDPGLKANDLVVTHEYVRLGTGWVSQSLTASGTTIGAVTSRNPSSPWGLDEFAVTAGTSTAAPTFVANSSATDSGWVFFIRLREVEPTPNFTFRAAGATSSSATVLAPGYPAGVVLGDVLILGISTKYETNLPTQPSGWNALASIATSGLTNGTDQGNVVTTAFWKLADSGDVTSSGSSGTLSISSAGNTGIAVMVAYARTNPGQLVTLTAITYASSGNGVGSTSYTMTASGGSATYSPGDVVVAVAALPSNVRISAEVLAISARSYTTTERVDAGATVGSNVSVFVVDANMNVLRTGSPALTGTTASGISSAGGQTIAFVRMSSIPAFYSGLFPDTTRQLPLQASKSQYFPTHEQQAVARHEAFVNITPHPIPFSTIYSRLYALYLDNYSSNTWRDDLFGASLTLQTGTGGTTTAPAGATELVFDGSTYYGTHSTSVNASGMYRLTFGSFQASTTNDGTTRWLWGWYNGNYIGLCIDGANSFSQGANAFVLVYQGNVLKASINARDGAYHSYVLYENFGSSQVTLYVDGTLQGTLGVFLSDPEWNSSANWYLGANPNYGYSSFLGQQGVLGFAASSSAFTTTDITNVSNEIYARTIIPPPVHSDFTVAPDRTLSRKYPTFEQMFTPFYGQLTTWPAKPFFQVYSRLNALYLNNTTTNTWTDEIQGKSLTLQTGTYATTTTAAGAKEIVFDGSTYYGTHPTYQTGTGLYRITFGNFQTTDASSVTRWLWGSYSTVLGLIFDGANSFGQGANALVMNVGGNYITAAITANNGGYHRYIVYEDPTGTTYFYVDGALQGSVATYISDPSWADANTWYLGANPGYGYSSFLGQQGVMGFGSSSSPFTTADFNAVDAEILSRTTLPPPVHSEFTIAPDRTRSLRYPTFEQMFAPFYGQLTTWPIKPFFQVYGRLLGLYMNQFNSGTGVWTDEINGNPLTKQTGTAASTTSVGGATELTFDGSTYYGLNATSSYPYASTTQVGYRLQFGNFKTTDTGTVRILWGSYGSPYYTEDRYLLLDGAGSFGPVGSLVYNYYNNNYGTVRIAGPVVNDGKYHRWILHEDVSSGITYFYVDGNYIGSLSTNFDTDPQWASNHWYLGADPNNGYSSFVGQQGVMGFGVSAAAFTTSDINVVDAELRLRTDGPPPTRSDFTVAPDTTASLLSYLRTKKFPTYLQQFTGEPGIGWLFELSAGSFGLGSRLKMFFETGYNATTGTWTDTIGGYTFNQNTSGQRPPAGILPDGRTTDLVFSGSLSQKLQSPSIPTFKSGGVRLQFGIFKIAGNGAGSGGLGILWSNYTSSPYAYLCYDPGNTQSQGANRLVYVSNPGSAAASNAAVNDGNWHRYMIVEDTTLATPRTTLYLDGVAQTVTSSTALTAAPWDANLQIGDINSGGSTFNGNLACFGFAYAGGSYTTSELNKVDQVLYLYTLIFGLADTFGMNGFF